MTQPWSLCFSNKGSKHITDIKVTHHWAKLSFRLFFFSSLCTERILVWLHLHFPQHYYLCVCVVPALCLRMLQWRHLQGFAVRCNTFQTYFMTLSRLISRKWEWTGLYQPSTGFSQMVIKAWCPSHCTGPIFCRRQTNAVYWDLCFAWFCQHFNCVFLILKYTCE